MIEVDQVVVTQRQVQEVFAVLLNQQTILGEKNTQSLTPTVPYRSIPQDKRQTPLQFLPVALHMEQFLEQLQRVINRLRTNH